MCDGGPWLLPTENCKRSNQFPFCTEKVVWSYHQGSAKASTGREGLVNRGAWCVAIITRGLYKIASTTWIYLACLMAPILQDAVQSGGLGRYKERTRLHDQGRHFVQGRLLWFRYMVATILFMAMMRAWWGVPNVLMFVCVLRGGSHFAPDFVQNGCPLRPMVIRKGVLKQNILIRNILWLKEETVIQRDLLISKNLLIRTQGLD